MKRKNFTQWASSFRRKADNSLDWIEYKKILKNPLPFKSKEGYEELKKFVKEKSNPFLQKFIDNFSKVSSLTEFNQWLNEYADLLVIGELCLEISQQIAKKLGENFQWSYPFYKSYSVDSKEIGKFMINLYIFEFKVS